MICVQQCSPEKPQTEIQQWTEQVRVSTFVATEDGRKQITLHNVRPTTNLSREQTAASSLARVRMTTRRYLIERDPDRRDVGSGAHLVAGACQEQW